MPEIVQLSKDKIPFYMQQTYLQSVQHQQRLEDREYRTEDDGWWYGGRPYGWSDDWVM